MASDTRPLTGLRVLELGMMVAAPFATRLLADFGAEVIKVELPGQGDTLRKWRVLHQGTSLWWRVQSRNKKCITLDLRHPEGQRLARRLAAACDMVVENFRPGTLERWNLGPEQLKAENPGLIFVRVSGYGQDGPYRDRVGLGNVAEAVGGLRYITGEPDGPPVRVGISIGDALASLHAVIGGLMALYHRDRPGGSGRGQVIDVALYEAVFNMMESTLLEYDVFGIVRERTGSRLPGIVPSNTYPTADGKYVVIGANTDPVFKRMMEVIGRPDLAEDPALATNDLRAARVDELDGLISAWTRSLPLATVLEQLEVAGVPAGPIYSIADIVADPQFQARGMLETLDVPGLGPVKAPGVVPKLSETPGRVDWAGPDLGAHNDEVFRELLGLGEEELAAYRAQGVI